MKERKCAVCNRVVINAIIAFDPQGTMRPYHVKCLEKERKDLEQGTSNGGRK